MFGRGRTDQVAGDAAGNEAGTVWVATVAAEEQELGWDVPAAERLPDRVGELRAGVESVGRVLLDGMLALPATDGWAPDEVEATFSIALRTGGGVVVSAGRDRAAVVRLKVTYRRRAAS